VPGSTPPAAAAAPSAHATSGARIAAASGAILAREPDGTETVSFPEASAPVAAAAGSAATGPVAMSFAPAASDTPARSALTPPAASPPSAPARPGAADANDQEELYERMVTRLRRDLLAERERVGDLLGSRW
jgi:hypothetical protein